MIETLTLVVGSEEYERVRAWSRRSGEIGQIPLTWSARWNCWNVTRQEVRSAPPRVARRIGVYTRTVVVADPNHVAIVGDVSTREETTDLDGKPVVIGHFPGGNGFVVRGAVK